MNVRISHRFVLSFAVPFAAVLVCCLSADAGLYALYRFEDASGDLGATIADSTSNGYHGEVINAPIGFSTSPLPGQSGDFSGSNGIVSADLPGIGSTLGDFSIALWMRSADTAQNQIYLTDRHPVGGGNQLSVIYEYADDQIELFRGGLGGPDPRPGSQITMADTNWHHIVYTRTGTDYAYYLDGERTDIGTLTGDITGLVERLNIGAARSSDSVNAFNGQLDDVAWFDNGITEEQVGRIIGGDSVSIRSTGKMVFATIRSEFFLPNMSVSLRMRNGVKKGQVSLIIRPRLAYLFGRLLPTHRIGSRGTSETASASSSDAGCGTWLNCGR